MGQDYVHMLKAPLDPSHGLHGVLRYRREAQEPTIGLRVAPSSEKAQPSTDQSVRCEFCGRTANPPLGEEPKDFCCLRYREVFEEVAQERRLFLELREQWPERATRTRPISANEEELESGAAEWDSEERRLRQKEVERLYKEAQTRLSSENSFFHTNIISFQLSACASADVQLAVRKEARGEGPEPLERLHPPGSGPSGFGLNHQDNARVIQRFYSNGQIFLTGLPDGSAQVFYPSGNLAVIVVTDVKEKVCFVHDDLAPSGPIRALFQSGGRATCYHGNGKVWLNMYTWGGQSLDEGGARTRQWSWSEHTQTPVPFRPVFLSLNKHVGVRVLGRQAVFLSFLASGQQARFSVGSSVEPCDGGSPARGPSLCKEELVALAGRLHLRLVLTRLRWCHRFPSSPRHWNVGPDPVVLSLARKLLSVIHGVRMTDVERSFVQRCLQACR